MKNKTLEAMVRTQFNIPDDIHIYVEHLVPIGSDYHFDIRWTIEGGALSDEFKAKVSELGYDIANEDTL